MPKTWRNLDAPFEKRPDPVVEERPRPSVVEERLLKPSSSPGSDASESREVLEDAADAELVVGEAFAAPESTPVPHMIFLEGVAAAEAAAEVDEDEDEDEDDEEEAAREGEGAGS